MKFKTAIKEYLLKRPLIGSLRKHLEEWTKTKNNDVRGASALPIGLHQVPRKYQVHIPPDSEKPRPINHTTTAGTGVQTSCGK